MKKRITNFLISVFAGILIPVLLLIAFFSFQNKGASIPVISNDNDDVLSIVVRMEQENVTMDMEEYIFNVIAAEMPSEFELEAVKAQAIASRTYAMKAKQTGGKHGDGSVCTNSGCCQAFCTDFIAPGTYTATSNVDIFRRAVAETVGLVLTYQGDLIEATFFSCSGGATEDAMEVWGHNYPYLKSKPSPEYNNNQLYEEKVYSKEELEQLLKTTLPDDSRAWFSVCGYTDGGGIASAIIGHRFLSGTQIRKLLNLRSTLFTVSAEENQIRICSRGYGHRVGMSQYGAETMAMQGKNCYEILQYYYPGTIVQNILKSGLQ